MTVEQDTIRAIAAPAHDRGLRRLDGQVALVSGASSGLGRAIARRLAADGASVVCGDLRRTPVAADLDGEVATDLEIVAADGRAEYVQWNITDPDDTYRALEVAKESFGRLDILVANAGVALGGGPLPDEPEDTFRGHIEVNLIGTWNSIRLGLKALIAQGVGGRIVTVSSIAGLVGIAGVSSGYAATKAAIIQLTRQAAVDGAPHGITANAVCPGYVRTAINQKAWVDPDTSARLAALHPLGRMGETSDVVGAVAFLASPDAAWVTGVALPVDGGMACA